ncbi:hypothetical protein BH20BAC1_BH20BAC1_18460 [soil metagenome]
MFKAYNILLLACIFSAGCSEEQKKPDPPSQAVNEREEDVPVFPVTEYLIGQLREMDSLPITPLKIIDAGGKKDSAWLKKDQIDQYARPFLHPVIDSSLITQYFSRNSFMDQTIYSVTFSYDAVKPLPGGAHLNQCIVYVDPEKNTVQRIYMVKKTAIDHGTLDSQLTWKSGKYFSIRTIQEIEGKPNEIKEQIVKWDFREDTE